MFQYWFKCNGAVKKKFERDNNVNIKRYIVSLMLKLMKLAFRIMFCRMTISYLSVKLKKEVKFSMFLLDSGRKHINSPLKCK